MTLAKTFALSKSVDTFSIPLKVPLTVFYIMSCFGKAKYIISACLFWLSHAEKFSTDTNISFFKYYINCER